jgi:1-acyl-sn-glycerol-3-phosphate acyltransferase
MGPRNDIEERAFINEVFADPEAEIIADAEVVAEKQPTFVDRRSMVAVDAVLDALRPWLQRFFEPHVRGMEHLPEGAALIVANHNAGVLMPDVFILADAIRQERGEAHLPYALVHDALLSFGPMRARLEKLGALRADAGGAKRAFAAGKKVLVFPGGDLESMRAYRNRHRVVFGPRRGYVKLAIRQGVPIVPIVTVGAHEAFMVLSDGARIASFLRLPKWLRVNVCPTVLSVPWGLTVGFPPPFVPVPTRIVMECLAPIHFARSGEGAALDEAYVEACHQQVLRAMQAAMTRIAEHEEVGVRARFRRHRSFAEPVGAWAEEMAERIMGWTSSGDVIAEAAIAQ